MNPTVNRMTQTAILATAILLSACVIAPNEHPNHSGYNNNIYGNASDNNSISERAQNACFQRMGAGAQIEKISDLKPGWFEVIMLNPNNGRKSACTVNQQGIIDDWVEM